MSIRVKLVHILLVLCTLFQILYMSRTCPEYPGTVSVRVKLVYTLCYFIPNLVDVQDLSRGPWASVSYVRLDFYFPFATLFLIFSMSRTCPEGPEFPSGPASAFQEDRGHNQPTLGKSTGL